MSIILVGMPATGKTTIAKELEKKGFERYLTYTTRPMRDGEFHGEDYYFWDEKLFMNEKKKGFFFETKSYEVASGDTWWYGSTLVFLHDPKGVIILDTEGVYKVLGYCKKHSKVKKPFIVLLHTPEKIIFDRMIARGDDLDEATRRIQTDRFRFNEFWNKGPWDTFVNTISVEESVQIIMDEYEKYTQK